MKLKTSALILIALSGLFFLAPGSKNACAGGLPSIPGIPSIPGLPWPFGSGGPFGGGGGGGAGGGGGGAGGNGEIAEQTCDTQVWRTMENRARLETEREIMQNQNLIFKADSILNYTCFDSFAAHATANVGVLFTHTTYFTGSEIIPWGNPYGMDYNMNEVIIKSMEPYIETNFDHTYLGGRGQYVGLDYPVINEIPPKGDQYQCDVMKEVWKVAKCLNFIHVQDWATTDGYYPFIDLKAIDGEDVAGYSNDAIHDTRKYPTECTGEPITGSTWEEMYRLSRNETGFGANDAYYQYGNPMRNTYEAVRLLVEPGECGAAIKTGVEVILGPGESASRYPDGVCTNPGCSYRKDGTCSSSPPT